jgi:hypothetical protein
LQYILSIISLYVKLIWNWPLNTRSFEIGELMKWSECLFGFFSLKPFVSFEASPQWFHSPSLNSKKSLLCHMQNVRQLEFLFHWEGTILTLNMAKICWIDVCSLILCFGGLDHVVMGLICGSFNHLWIEFKYCTYMFKGFKSNEIWIEIVNKIVYVFKK